MENKLANAEYHMRQNVTLSVTDSEGKQVKLFQMNKLGQSILSYIRTKVSDPVAKDGTIKPGLLNHLSAYGVRVPFVTGMWSNSLSIANLITTAGKAALASRLNGSGSEAAFTYIGLGTGATAADAADTTLQTEITDSGLARAAATVSRVTTTTANDTARLTYTWTASGTKAVTESGCLNAASAGTLLNRQVFSAVNLVSGNSFQATHDFAVS